jgi:hypothetical protein
MVRRLAQQSPSALPSGFPSLESLERRRFFAAATFNDVFIATKQSIIMAAVGKAPKKPGRPDLQAGSDDGARSNDDVTTITNPIFDIDRVDANTTVQLLRDGVVVASVYSVAGGTVSLTDGGPVPLGMHQYTSRLVSATGVIGDVSMALQVQIVAPPTPPAPPAAPTMPDVQSSSDTGQASDDNLTAAANLSFTIAGVTSGLTVQLMRDGAVVAMGVAASTSITLTDASASADGSYAYTAIAIDGVTGLSSTASTSLAVMIDRTPPAASAPDLAAAYDFGRSDSDDITSATSLGFEVAVAESDGMVELLRDGVVVASAASSAGVMTLADPATLADGIYGYATRVTDAAGNSSTGGTVNVTVDATAPTASTPDLSATSDTGGSNSDNITASTNLSFAVADVEDGATVELMRDGVVVNSASGTAGTMHLVDPYPLIDGVYTYATRVTDVAGNVSVSGSMAVTVDTMSPGATSAPVLSDASDLGLKGDNATRDRMPVMIVSGADPYAVVELMENGVVIASTVADATGMAMLGPASQLTPGTHTFTARQIDAAGNMSPQSAAGSVKIINALASSDYDGDGISDTAIYSAGTWTIALSGGGTKTAVLGGAADVPVPGDYDGDGITDIAMYRPSGRSIRVMPSSMPDTVTVQFISTTFQLPVCADYDGDGKTDFAVYNNTTGVFTIMNSTGGTSTVTMQAGALPVVADYDGDGKADIAVYDPVSTVWTIMKSTGGMMTETFGLGDGSDQPLPADYNGDGFDDLGMYKPVTGTFSILTPTGTLNSVMPANEIAFVGDFDGDGKFDPGTYSQAAALFSIFRSSAGKLSMTLGTAGGTDQPLPLSIAQVRKDVLGF